MNGSAAEMPLRIGTRGSQLALWQANAVASLLAGDGIRSDIVVIKTTGDRSQAGPVPGDDSKRQFVKELEDALLDDRADLCVHSAKDLPVDLPPGLTLAACLPREDPRDAIVLPAGHAPAGWPDVLARLGAASGAVIGTGSVRRRAQLQPLLPDARFSPVRGNVDTRLHKLDRGEFDALVLACAGLRRLGFEGRISAAVPIEQCVPAPGQGIVATEIRAGDARVRAILDRIHDPRAGAMLAAERALVQAIGGGCDLPLGAIAAIADGAIEMHAVAAAPDGSRTIRRTLRQPEVSSENIGRRLGDELRAAGAADLLQGHA